MKKEILTLLITSIALLANANNNYDKETTNRSKVQKNGSQYVESHHKDGEKVYFCKGDGAYAFHLYSDCSGLHQCKAGIIEMPQKQAQDSTRNRCKRCWNRLQKEKGK